ncbi:hypothetical protein [Meiothermus sp. Pnk-1]|uniref:hypothetical protein n=1 Tax=Meiothermus sp. Pnk-1 TaxID=873128 RepID=UPI000D7BE019|nr:hypothetical protein [Meiothermus sp. Pnk-1]PZA07427.1 hypothetical protein DNA98_07295 [Meiothermus sp. Pnk-1]
MELEAREFWRLLEHATWVVWEGPLCFVWLPGEGGRVFRYEDARVVVLAEGEAALEVARRMGVKDALAVA